MHSAHYPAITGGSVMFASDDMFVGDIVGVSAELHMCAISNTQLTEIRHTSERVRVRACVRA
jgi:hypothetical protein